MFQFPWFPLPALCVQAGVTPHDGCWVAPFRNPRIEGWSAPPRGLSQPPTSFIGSHRQGIHRWPLITWVLHTKMLVLAMKFSRNAGEQGARARKDAPMAPRTGTAAYLHNARQDGYRRLERTLCERGVPAPDECINWVSRLDTEQMSVNRAELDSLERR
jgi:hypothetical protein